MLPLFTFKNSHNRTRFPAGLHKRNTGGFFFCIILCFTALSLLSGDTQVQALVQYQTTQLSASLKENKQTATNTVSNTSAVTASGQDLSVSFTYGFDKASKYGRQMNLCAEIANTGKDFSGTIGILSSPNNSSEEALYEVPCVIAAGETKKIELTAPVSGNNWPSLLIKDEKEHVVLQKYFRITMTTQSDIVFLGVLADDTDDFSYISSTGLAKMFLLNETTLPSTAEGLDCLDILMISNFNTDRLSREQIDAVLEWTRQGGMLVFGTGATASKTLSAFEESIFSGTIGNVEKRTTLLGMNEKELLSLKEELYNSVEQPLDMDEMDSLNEDVKTDESTEDSETDETEESKTSTFADRISKNEIKALTLKVMPKDMISLELENFVPILSEQDGFDLIVKNNYGNGTILTAAFELGMEAQYRNSMGVQLYHIIEDNFSETKRLELRDETVYKNSYTLSRALGANKQTSYPHLKLYFIILIVYAVITGPILYLILKKADKRHLLWLLMPGSCLLCTAVIYLAGGSTRITEPYIRYLSFLKMEQTEETPSCTQNVYFNITAPYNRKYSVSLSDVSDIGIRNNDNYYYSYSYDTEEPTSSSYYKTAIYKDGSNDTTLIMNDYAAFHAACFYCTSSKTDTNFSGTFDSNLELNEDFTVTGTLTNRLGIDLYQAVYICNGQLYILGSMKDGDMVSLKDCDYAIFNSTESLESGLTTSNVDTLTAISGSNGWNSDSTSLERQLYFAYEYYLESDSSLFTDNGRIIAVTENGTVDFLQNTGLSTSGLQMLDIHITAPKLDTHTVESLDNSFVSVLEGDNSFPFYRYIDTAQTISYHISHPETLLSLSYQKSGNGEFYSDKFSGYYLPVFNGTVSAYNIFTGEYDELFQAGNVGSCKDLSSYISSDGQMTIRYEKNSLANTSCMIPVLYLVKSE